MRSRGNIRLFLLLLLMLVGTVTFAAPAEAQTIDTCNSNIRASNPLHPTFQSWEFTARVIGCLQGMVVIATRTLMQMVSDYMTGTVTVMIALAIAVYGFRILSGEEQLKPKMVGFGIRLGLVWMFFYNLGGWTEDIFAIEDELILMVTGGGYNPWQRIDVFFGNMLGFGENTIMLRGLLGILGGSLLSSTVSIILAIIGFMAIFDIFTFIVRAVFIYISAYVAIGFLLVLSPILIPTALFFSTERYFQKWLHILISAILLPIILFAFFQMFLGVFDILIGDIFARLGSPPCDRNIYRFPGTPDRLAGLGPCNTPPGPGNWWTDGSSKPDFRSFWKLNTPIFSWMMPGDPNMDQALTHVGAESLSDPAVQSNVIPHGRRAFSAGINVPTIDFGHNHIPFIQRLLADFVVLWLFASLMKSMTDKIPEVADNLAAVSSRIGMSSFSAKHAISEAQSTVKSGISQLGGAAKSFLK